MGFFSKVAKGIGKAVSGVTKTVGKVVKTVAPVAAVIPGIGSVVSGAASAVGELLSPTKEAAIYEAVDEQGVVKVDKIESTLVKENPNIDVPTLKAATEVITQNAISNTPTAKVDDSKAEVTKVDFLTKAVQWIKSNFVIVGVGALGLLFILKGDKRSRRRW